MSIAKKGFKKGLAWLMVLAIAVTFMPNIAFSSFAAASDTVTLSYVDKAGQSKTIETWYYDSSKTTYNVGSASGSELSLVRDFSTREAINQINPSLASWLDANNGYYESGETKTYALPYTGINRKPDPRCISVATKGIILEDILDYLGDKAGMSLKGSTAMTVNGSGNEKTYDEYWGKDRFFYPGWYFADSFTAKSFTDSYSQGDTTAGARSEDTDLGKGYKVPTTMVITGYHDTTGGEISSMISKADSENALRNMQSQQAGGSDDDINMGFYSWKNIENISFTPVYNSITVAGGTAAEGAEEGEAGYKFTADKVTISTDDNYFKAAAGEKVVLTVTPDEGREVKTVEVTDTDSAKVDVTAGENGTYSFTMPEKAVTVKTDTKYATDTGWYSKDGKSFELKTKKELAGLAAIVNGTADGIEQDDFAGKTITLKNDIALDDSNSKYDVSEGTFGTSSYGMKAKYYTVKENASIWTPIGTGEAAGNVPSKSNYFKGTFDGEGHTVSGIYTDGGSSVQGLFGCLGEGAVVKNITTEGCVTAKVVAGGIAAYINGATVENCTNKAIVYADGGQAADSGLENGVSRGGAVGGIIGCAAGESKVSGCANSADITCTNTAKGGRVGGIIGLIDNTADKVDISECFNSGAIDAYQYAGGIVGMNVSKSSPADRCGNIGDVKGHSPGTMFVGGISAQFDSDITNSYNTGDFIGWIDANRDKASTLGGIAGSFGGNKISNCYNAGSYEGGGNAKINSSTGGIAGKGYGTLSANKLENCYILKGTGYDNEGYAEDKSSDELRSVGMIKTLKGEFAPDYDDINDGYPVLKWQLKQENIPAVAEDYIAAIGDVTLNSGEAIADARAAYDALSKSERKKVENYAELTLAEEEYAAIKNVYDRIAAIDKDKTGMQDETAIEEARAAYNALTKSEKKKIKNYSVLTEAEADIAEIRKENTPSKAAAVKASAKSYNSVSISWNATDKATGYEIWRSTSKTGTYKKVGSTARTSYINTSLATGTTYYYKVKAWGEADGVRLYAEDSAAVSAKPVLAKTTVKLTAGSKKATVKWSKVSGANGYKIYRSTKKTSGFKCIRTVKSGSTVKYVNSGLRKGKTYYYKVKAYRTVAGKAVYGSYSTVKSVKAK